MHWNLISHQPKLTFQLLGGEKILMNLSILNNKLPIIRAECKTHKRVFFIEKEGLWKPKSVLKNEYGYTIGHIIESKINQTKGIVEIDNNQFYYELKSTPEHQIILYIENEEEPYLSCDLSNIFSSNILFPKSRINHLEYLLFALTWYLFLPATTNKINKPVLSFH